MMASCLQKHKLSIESYSFMGIHVYTPWEVYNSNLSYYVLYRGLFLAMLFLSWTWFRLVFNSPRQSCV